MVLAAPAAASAAFQPFAYCPFAPSSLAYEICPPRNVLFKLDAGVEPQKLPQREMAPVTLMIQGEIAMSDDTHPPALREAILDFDKNGSIDTAGLPACERRRIEGRVTGQARAACRNAIVGGGTALIQVAPPGIQPTLAPARLTLFNSGVKAGVTKLLVHATIAASEPVSVIATVKIEKAQSGRYGWTTTTTAPRLFEGLGSVLSFELRIGRRFVHEGAQRSYLTARCFDGRLNANMIRAVFRAEAGNPSTTTLLRGTVIRPCTQAGPSDGSA